MKLVTVVPCMYWQGWERKWVNRARGLSYFAACLFLFFDLQTTSITYFKKLNIKYFKASS